MKFRTDFVTNSSSSSFLISRDDVKDKKELKKLLTKLVVKEAKRDGWYEEFEDKKDIKHCRDIKYVITKATKKHPYEHRGVQYTNHYVVENEGGVHYDFYLIENYFEKKGIDITRGYCD